MFLLKTVGFVAPWPWCKCISKYTWMFAEMSVCMRVYEYKAKLDAWGAYDIFYIFDTFDVIDTLDSCNAHCAFVIFDEFHELNSFDFFGPLNAIDVCDAFSLEFKRLFGIKA